MSSTYGLRVNALFVSRARNLGTIRIEKAFGVQGARRTVRVTLGDGNMTFSTSVILNLESSDLFYLQLFL